MLKPHLSVSQLNTLANCGEAYRRSYVEREKIPPNYAMLRGRAVHGGAELNFGQKIGSHCDLPSGQIVDASVAQLELEAAKGVELAAEDRGRSRQLVHGEAVDEVAKLARLHATTQAPVYQPVAVETAIRVVLPDKTHDLVSVLDMVDDAGRVVDFKTKRKPMTTGEVAESLQFTAYAFARKIQTGEYPVELVMENLINTGTTQKRQRIATTRGDEDVAVLAARFDAAVRAKEAGIYQPAAIGAWNCCQAYCGYWSTCAYAAGKKGAQGD